MQEFRFPHCRSQKGSRELIHDLSGCNISKKSLANIHLRKENQNVADISASNVSYGSLLKFMMLFGFLTLQGSQPAVAGSGLSSALQSISYLGDLGEIKTGFASVRKISLLSYNYLLFSSFFVAAGKTLLCHGNCLVTLAKLSSSYAKRLYRFIILINLKITR